MRHRVFTNKNLRSQGGDPSATGPRPPDGLDFWPALSGANLTSPRTEVIHAVTNRYFNASLGDVGVQAARFGDWKLILGTSCDSKKVWQPWPELGAPVAFGRSGGTVEAGTDHARADLLGGTEDGEAEEAAADGAAPCLYNLASDPAERTNLAGDPAHAQLLAGLIATLRARAATGPPLASAFADVGGESQPAQ